MKIEVTVKPGSSREGVEPAGDGRFIVRVRARAVEGQANDAVREALAEHWDVARSRVRLVSGLRARKKVFEIEE